MAGAGGRLDSARMGARVPLSIARTRPESERVDKPPSGRSRNPGDQEILDGLWRAFSAIASDQLSGNGRVLDIGCGTGGWLRALSDVVDDRRLYGVDASADPLRAARERVPRATLAVADARRLPFEAGEFDLVLMFTVLMFVPEGRDTEQAVHEAERVLAPGGLLVIYDMRMPNPFNRSNRPIRRGEIPLPVRSRTLTLFPPLARSLGPLTPTAYPILERVPALRSHRLWWYQKPS